MRQMPSILLVLRFFCCCTCWRACLCCCQLLHHLPLPSVIFQSQPYPFPLVSVLALAFFILFSFVLQPLQQEHTTTHTSGHVCQLHACATDNSRVCNSLARSPLVSLWVACIRPPSSTPGMHLTVPVVLTQHCFKLADSTHPSAANAVPYPPCGITSIFHHVLWPSRQRNYFHSTITFTFITALHTHNHHHHLSPIAHLCLHVQRLQRLVQHLSRCLQHPASTAMVI